MSSGEDDNYYTKVNKKYLKKIKKEFKVYKKALDLACKELDMRDDFCIGTELKKSCIIGNCGNCKECWKEYFLRKAGEKNDT